VGLLDEPLDGPAPHPERMSLLMVEDRYAGREIGNRIVAEGYQRVLYVGREDITASRLRLAGVRDSVEPHSIVLEQVSCGMNYRAGRLVAAQLAGFFENHPSPGVVVAANDWLAVGIRTGLAEVGVPEDTAPILSFDGLPIASEPTLGIRSLAYPMVSIVDDAIAELRRLARHQRGRVIRYTMEWTDGWSALSDES